MNKFLNLLTRFRRDERGAFLALFGLLAIVLIATAGATVDFTSVQNARTRAQVALDAAALALQPEIYNKTYATEAAMEADIKTKAQAVLLNRLVGATYTTASVTMADGDKPAGTLTLTAQVKAPLIFVALVGVKEMNMTLVSQATKGSQDLEVAVALDVTGSMSTSDKIGDLIDAANEMVDIIVLDEQEPTYTKMAIVPWSMGVNLGSYAAAARGAIPPAKGVTGAVVQTGSTATITGISKANPAVITATGHGFSTGDTVWISGITSRNDWTGLNDRKYTITRINNNSFSLDGTSTNGYSNSWQAGGSVRRCANTACQVTITSTAHAFANNAVVYFTNVGGMTQLNNNAFTATAVTANTFNLSGTNPADYSGTYTSGGNAWCTTYGCEYYRFQNAWGGGWNIHRVSTCVTERVTSPNQYNDIAPGTTPVGLNYAATGNPCLTNQVVPLTSDKTLLHDTINAFQAAGSTAGQTGTAWAWYMLAPNFASIWPADRRPAAYLQGNVIKVVVLMTDGSFNSVYCNGVISADSTTGSGSASDHINCDATNGEPFAQTRALCDGMKDPSTGIVVYTVGFDISDQSNEQAVLSYCATDSSKYYLADNSAQLTAAFQSIAQDIAQLRLSE